MLTPALMPKLETIAAAFIITAVMVAFLYLGGDILVPLALATLLSFTLWPLIKLLRKLGAGRATSVLAAVFLAIAGLMVMGSIMAVQVTNLASELPKYEQNLRGKVRALKGASMPSRAMEQAADTIQGLQDELRSSDTGASSPGPTPRAPVIGPGATQNSIAQKSGPVVVEMHQQAPSFLQSYQELVRPLLSPLTTTALVILFLIFILIQREDLRDRLLRIAGGSDLQRSTMAMNEAADRLSRFFLMQLTINAVFGFVIGTGLALIGVPSSILWGILAALMRFVPYVGTLVAAFFPIALAAAVDPSWTMVLSVAGLFFVTVPIAGQVIEPMLYGQSTGLSPVAVVVAALFWTLMWGPVGLLLSTPLTVCLVVLGKHIPALEFLAVVLGDKPALAPDQRLYQRLLAGVAADAVAAADEELQTKGLLNYYDAVAMKALKMAHLDATRGRLDPGAQLQLLSTVREVTLELDDYELNAPPAAIDIESRVVSPEPAALVSPVDSSPVLCLSTRSSLDEAAALFLSQILIRRGLSTRVIARGDAASLTGIDFSNNGSVVCLSHFETENPFQVRTLVRRLKRTSPSTQIIAGFWLLGDEPEKLRSWKQISGADYAVATLNEAVGLCLTVASGRAA